MKNLANLVMNEMVTANREKILNRIRGYIQNDICFNEIVYKEKLFQGPCFQILASKFFGCLLITCVLLCQVPQIFKILRTRNASGVSCLSIALMIEASSSCVAHALFSHDPLISWLEYLVLMIENVILLCLMLTYNKRPSAALSFVTIYVICMFTLIVPMVSQSFLNLLNDFSIPTLIISRIIQIFTNHKNHSTGQLSATSTFIFVFLSFGRVTNNFFVARNWVDFLTFCPIPLLNLVLIGQVVHYRRSCRKTQQKDPHPYKYKSKTTS